MKPVKEWTREQIKNYYLGIEFSDYPAVFWERMEPVLVECETLTDIGCGPGAFALKALEAGLRVQAVDFSHKNLAALQKKAGDAPGLKLIYGCWPEVKVEKSDATVCAYCFGGEIGTQEGIGKVIAQTDKVAFFIAPAGTTQTDFMSRELYQQAGLEPPSFSGDYQDLLHIFTHLNEEVEWETISYDFGMPLKNKNEIESCAVYLADKLGLPDPVRLREHLQQITTIRHGTCWVPNPRQSGIITWRRN